MPSSRFLYVGALLIPFITGAVPSPYGNPVNGEIPKVIGPRVIMNGDIVTIRCVGDDPEVIKVAKNPEQLSEAFMKKFDENLRIIDDEMEAIENEIITEVLEKNRALKEKQDDLESNFNRLSEELSSANEKDPPQFNYVNFLGEQLRLAQNAIYELRTEIINGPFINTRKKLKMSNAYEKRRLLFHALATAKEFCARKYPPTTQKEVLIPIPDDSVPKVSCVNGTCALPCRPT